MDHSLNDAQRDRGTDGVINYVAAYQHRDGRFEMNRDGSSSLNVDGRFPPYRLG